MKAAARLVLAFVFATAVFSAHAQYPNRPVRIVMPYAVGGTGDILIRILAQKISQDTGHSFIVENKPGAAGRIGYQMVAAAAPDGYSFVAADGGYAMLPALSSSLPWNFEKDLVPVTIYADTPYVIVVTASSRIKSLRDLLSEAKADPGKLNYGSSGTGGATHVAMEMLLQKAGVSITHVPYKGNGEAIVGLMSGAIEVLLTSVPTAIAQVKAGKVRALAVTSRTRVAALSDVPTAAEAGLDVDLSNWYSIMAPAATPRQDIDYVVEKIAQALQSPQVKESFSAQGATPVIMSPAQFAKILRADAERWRTTIRTAGIKAE
jgi:tripartite-type tricarboxylate transporter receptor subunit TctC